MNFACIDLAPCSPRRPNPTCILLAHCNVWCSRRCILMGVMAFGNAFLKLSMHEARSVWLWVLKAKGQMDLQMDLHLYLLDIINTLNSASCRDFDQTLIRGLLETARLRKSPTIFASLLVVNWCTRDQQMHQFSYSCHRKCTEPRYHLAVILLNQKLASRKPEPKELLSGSMGTKQYLRLLAMQ